MLTPQEVSTHAFAKAVMGGYNMAMVDEFLDELTDDYTALYKENAALKAKMKVLVEKVEDYRATEDSMRATLLTAQKMADSIVHEAEAKRDALLSRAEMDAREFSKSDDRRTAVYLIDALVAQLDRVTDSDSVGRTFESCRAYQNAVKSYDFTAFLYRIVQIICFYCVAQPDRAFWGIA